MVLKIPQQSFNAFNQIESDPNAIVYRNHNFKEDSDYISYWETVKFVGKKADVRGPILYNPYGGFDIVTQFILSEDVTDVISNGIEPFGDVQSLKKLSEQEDLLQKLTEKFVPWDYVGHIQTISNLYGGILPGATGRLVKQLNATIQGVYFFEFGQNGEIEFNQARNGNNGVISFSHNGLEKRWWYFQGTESLIVPGATKQFLHKLKTDTLLLKAFSSNVGSMHAQYFEELALYTARKGDLDTCVLTDLNGGNSLHPIWKRSFNPGVPNMYQLLGRTPSFGYSNTIAWGTGADLLSTESFFEMIG